MSNLTLNERGEREIIKEVGEILPHVGISVFPEAFVVETVPREFQKIPSRDGNSTI